MGDLEFNTPISNDMVEAQKKIQGLVNSMYKAKLESDVAEAKFKKLKGEVSALMESTGTEKITGDECNVSGSIKSNVSVPKDEADKLALFEYIKGTYSEEVLTSMLTINARSFTSWYTAEVEKYAKQGNANFKLEMVKPHETYSLSIRKKSVKK